MLRRLFSAHRHVAGRSGEGHLSDHAAQECPSIWIEREAANAELTALATAP
jgi:hypothetical protein